MQCNDSAECKFFFCEASYRHSHTRAHTHPYERTHRLLWCATRKITSTSYILFILAFCISEFGARICSVVSAGSEPLS
jgi:hypothetical protein